MKPSDNEWCLVMTMMVLGSSTICICKAGRWAGQMKACLSFYVLGICRWFGHEQLYGVAYVPDGVAMICLTQLWSLDLPGTPLDGPASVSLRHHYSSAHSADACLKGRCKLLLVHSQVQQLQPLVAPC